MGACDNCSQPDSPSCEVMWDGAWQAGYGCASCREAHPSAFRDSLPQLQERYAEAGRKLHQLRNRSTAIAFLDGGAQRQETMRQLYELRAEMRAEMRQLRGE